MDFTYAMKHSFYIIILSMISVSIFWTCIFFINPLLKPAGPFSFIGFFFLFTFFSILISIIPGMLIFIYAILKLDKSNETVDQKCKLVSITAFVIFSVIILFFIIMSKDFAPFMLLPHLISLTFTSGLYCYKYKLFE